MFPVNADACIFITKPLVIRHTEFLMLRNENIGFRDKVLLFKLLAVYPYIKINHVIIT